VDAARRRAQEEHARVQAEREAKRKATEEEEAQQLAAAKAKAARIRDLPQVYVDLILDICYQYGGADEAQLRVYCNRHFHPNYTVTSYDDETGRTTFSCEQCIVGWAAAYQLNGGASNSIMARRVRRLLAHLQTGKSVEHDVVNARKAILDVDMEAPSPASWFTGKTVKVEYGAMYRYPGKNDKLARQWMWFDPETHKLLESRVEQTRPADPRAR
jgi:heat shock protein HspQ